jgi:putative transposase
MPHQLDGEKREVPLVRLTDEEWEKVRPLLEAHDPPSRLGRKRANPRAVLEAIIYRQRSGCPWNCLPREYPDDSTVHRTYQRWKRLGIIDQLLDTFGERPASR